jgi:hypothetical protein
MGLKCVPFIFSNPLRHNSFGWLLATDFLAPFSFGGPMRAPATSNASASRSGPAHIRSSRFFCAGSSFTRHPRTLSRFSKSVVYSGNQ